jgi:hypothetical protein
VSSPAGAALLPADEHSEVDALDGAQALVGRSGVPEEDAMGGGATDLPATGGRDLTSGWTSSTTDARSRVEPPWVLAPGHRFGGRPVEDRARSRPVVLDAGLHLARVSGGASGCGVGEGMRRWRGAGAAAARVEV